MKLLRATALLWILIAMPATAENQRRDGNWWRAEAEMNRVMYLTGFFDGMDLGNLYSWIDLPTRDGKLVPAANLTIDMYNAKVKKYFTNVTTGQLSDGLNVFFEDYRNRSILVKDAVTIVVKSIAGDSDKEIDNLTKSYRRVVGSQ